MSSSSTTAAGSVDLAGLLDDAHAALAELAEAPDKAPADATAGGAAQAPRVDPGLGDRLVAVGRLALRAGLAALGAADPGPRSDAALAEEIVEFASAGNGWPRPGCAGWRSSTGAAAPPPRWPPGRSASGTPRCSPAAPKTCPPTSSPPANPTCWTRPAGCPRTSYARWSRTGGPTPPPTKPNGTSPPTRPAPAPRL